MKRSTNFFANACAQNRAQFQSFLLYLFSVLVVIAGAVSAHAQILYKSPQPEGSKVKLHRHQAAPTRNDRPQTDKEKADQARNVLYIHPPKIAAASRPAVKPTHAPPAPYAGPKVAPAAIVNRGALPKGERKEEENEEKEENTENLIRNWNNRRPMSEVKKAVHESLTMPSEPNKQKGHTPALPLSVAASLSTDSWEQVGSGDYNADNVHYQAGRIRQASYAYDNESGNTVLWLGSTGGGLWKAVDLFFAAVFVPMSDNLPGSPSVGAFLVQPGNSNNILIGSGDSYRYGGSGMFKTRDGAATWYPVDPVDGTSWPSAFQKVLIDLNDTSEQTVLAEGDTGIWRSTDFGDSWTQVYSGATSDLVQDPVNTYIWYAGAPGVGVLRSTSYGQSFGAIGSGIAGPIGRVSVAVSASNPEHVYAISAITNASGVSTSLGGIWRSDDYGDQTWNQIESTDNISGAGQAFHTTSINVDPNNADIVFAGMAGSEVTYNATAAAPSWTYSSSFDEGHADHTGYIFEPGTSNVISTTDGGVYVLDESTLSVSGSLNYATNLNVEQVFGPVGDLACSLNEPDECVLGLQDNGSITMNRNNTPTLVNVDGGDGNQVSIAPDNPSEMFDMADGARYYTTDSFADQVGDYGSCLSNNFYATTMIDQTPPNGFTPFIYTFSVPGSGGAASFIYYKPVDSNCDWAQANPNGFFDTNVFSPRSMDASNDPSGYVFYVVGWGTGTLNVFDSYSDGGSIGSMTYADRTPPVPSYASFNDSQIAADRSSSRPYTVTYTTGGSRPSQAFLSNDRGNSWTEVTGDLATKLPNANYWKLIANPGDQSQLFLATDQGVYRSDNFGTNWYRYMAGMPAVTNIFGMELNYDYSSPPLLHLGTYGRGFWDRQVGSDAVLASVVVSPTPVVGGQYAAVTVTLDRPAPQDTTVLLTSSNYSIFPVTSTIVIAAGNTSSFLIFQTGVVDSSSNVSITAQYNEVQTSGSVTVTTAPTATSITSGPSPSNPGQTVIFTAPVSSSYGSPTGSVAFYVDGNYLGSGTISGGSASLSISTLSSGTHSIQAAYAGAGSFAASTSGTTSQVVKYASATGLVSSLAHSTYGQSVTFTATVSGSAGAPSGTVTFTDGATILGTANLSGNHAVLSTSSLVAGTHAIQATYAGNGTYSSSKSASLSQAVNKVTSTNSLSASTSSTTYGQSVTFTAKLTTSTGAAVSGAVSFRDGTTTLGTSTLSGGEAILAVTSLSIGTHSITALYSGNTNINGSTSAPLTHAVEKSSSTTSLRGTPNPSEFGQAVIFTATVKSTTSGIPSGEVTFKNGGTTLATVALNGTGIASYSDNKLPIGSYSITAVYAGNADFNTSTSPTLKQTVNKQSSVASVTASLNPSAFNQPVLFTAKVKATLTGTPTGTVTFKNNGTTLAVVALNSSGSATYTNSTLSVGSHSITVVYSGNAEFLASTSSGLAHVVDKAATSTKLVAALNPSKKGQSVKLTATVTPAYGGSLAGTVTFKDGSTTLGSVTVTTSTRSASFTTSALATGTHHITALYDGNSDFDASTSSILNQVVK